LINIFGSKSQTLAQQAVDFIRQLVLHILGKLLCNDILLMYKTNIPSIFSVLLQLKDLIRENSYENIQINSKVLSKVGVFNIIFRKNEHS